MGFSISVMCPCVYSSLAFSSVFRGFVFPTLPAFRPVVFSSLRNCPVEDPCHLLVSFRFGSVRIYRSYYFIPCATGSSRICRRTRQTSMLYSNGENHASKRVANLFRFFNSVPHGAFFTQAKPTNRVFRPLHPPACTMYAPWRRRRPSR